MTAGDIAALLNKYAGEIIATILSPVILGLVGYWKLKRLGVNRSNIAEVEDRAKFRQHLLDRMEAVEKENAASLERERALQRQNSEQAAQISMLRGQVDMQEEEIRDLTAKKRRDHQEIRDLKRQVKSLTAQLEKVSRGTMT